jgi:transcriptional regulator with PAS, ATPase and Fis domain
MGSDGGRSNTQTISERLGSSHTRLVEPFLFVIFDADRPDGAVSRHGLADVDEIHLRRGQARQAFRQDDGGRRRLVLTFADPRMSSVHALIRRRGSTFTVEDAGSKNGTLLDGRRISKSELSNECLLEIGHTFLLFKAEAPVADGSERDVTIAEPAASDALSTLSTVLERTFRQVREVAGSSLPILVRGETGTGKEVVARAIHGMSQRRGSFVAINCGGIPSALVEAELFGFRKGSFSGATEHHTGLARAADGGTLFLDEIGDLPLAAQAAFLRMLQERKVVPIGGVSPLNADFRLVSATHRNLEELVSRGAFREDLLARLDAFAVELLPLRARREDLGLLVARLLGASDGGAALPFTLDAARSLLRHSWLRNVRELCHRVQLSLVLARSTGCIEREHLFAKSIEGVVEAGSQSRQTAARTASPAAGAQPLAPEDVVRRDEIIALLRQHGGNVTAVAQAMGKARAQVQRWMRRYGVDRRGLLTD